jgi:tRNA-Thr(GGU) m(6)t(6)A37 methyltransferase TsaA
MTIDAKIYLFFRTFVPAMPKMQPIATIRTGFPTKFGIPRQSGLVPQLKATIVFNPEYRNADALRGLEGFSHIWLIWEFSEAVREEWSPTVRPPRLGGNTRLGVFATRSPFRPNPIGLSCVRLESVELSSPNGPVLHVSGADLMDGTPIYDIKPYIPYTDCQPDATAGFTGNVSMHLLNVIIPHELEGKIKPGTLQALRGILAQDPRPRYQDDPERLYGFDFDGYSVKFKVPDPDTLTVTEITRNR